jgi:hypothetical protein
MTTTFAKDHHISSRKPQVLFQGKHGHRRNVGKIQGLIPLISKMDSLWFLDLRFLKDSHTNKEGNFGLGYRYKGHDSIFGFYGFFDRRSQLRDDVQKLSDSLYQEIHPTYLKRPPHKRFDFVHQYESFLTQVIYAESLERKNLTADDG